MKPDRPHPRPPGRPRGFEPDDARRAAMLVFWDKGYLGTSIDDLTAAMGINRPSLYGTFGDKERLFLACIDDYLAHFGRSPRQALRAPRLEDALRGFLKAAIENGTGDATPPGCLVACVLVGASSESEAIRAKLRDCLALTDAMLQERMDAAVLDGELPEHADVKRLARLLNSQRHGLLIRARAGEDRESLLSLVDDAVGAVLPTTRAASLNTDV